MRIAIPVLFFRRLALSSICAVALALLASPSAADLFEDLQELKKICDADLLTEKECAERRAKLLRRHDDEPPTWFCNYSGDPTPPEALFEEGDEGTGMGYSESASAQLVVREILDAAGLVPNFVVRPGRVPNASAVLRGSNRYIEYNPRFFSELKQDTRTNWAVYSVMAHEIGHHLQGHTLDKVGSRPPTELEADEYSGYILARLGASLEEASIAIDTVASDEGSRTHPPRVPRLRAIEKGWKKGVGGRGDRPRVERERTSPPPLPSPPLEKAPFTARCAVEGREILIDEAGEIYPEGYVEAPGDHPRCAFDLVAPYGRYCVNRDDFEVLLRDSRGWYSVGACIPCDVSLDCP
jgi:hypothetical protein